jgi:hypothetical protein
MKFPKRERVCIAESRELTAHKTFMGWIEKWRKKSSHSRTLLQRPLWYGGCSGQRAGK